MEQYIGDLSDKDKALHAIHTMPTIQQKAQWIVQCMNHENNFAAQSLHSPQRMKSCSGVLRKICGLKTSVDARSHLLRHAHLK